MNLLVTSLLLATLASAGEAVASEPKVERARYLMGTICIASAETADTARAARTLNAGFDEIARLEGILSSWREDSELSRLNAAGGSTWFACSPDLYAVLDSSLVYARLTRGAFDPTIEPINRLWGMRGKGRVPKPEEYDRVLMLVGYRKLNLDRDRRRVLFPFSDMGLDFGGIGKGYALDRAARLLAGAGLGRALLNFGGEVLAIGSSWPVDVAHPDDRLKAALHLEVSDGAVSTSAQSERGIVVKKKRYGHIFDPRTAQPVPGSASVTVIAATATRADALSTALLVMGREAAATFAEEHRDVGVLWLEPAGATVRAWKWNLPSARAESEVEWMN